MGGLTRLIVKKFRVKNRPKAITKRIIEPIPIPIRPSPEPRIARHADGARPSSSTTSAAAKSTTGDTVVIELRPPSGAD